MKKRKLVQKKRRSIPRKKGYFHKLIRGSSSVGVLGVMILVISFASLMGTGGSFSKFREEDIAKHSGNPTVLNTSGGNGPGLQGAVAGGGGVTTQTTGKDSLQLQTFTIVNEPTVPQPLTTPQCRAGDSDTMLIIDHSSTMKGSKLQLAKNAAKKFVDIIGRNANNQVGLSIFDERGDLYSALTIDHTSVKSQIDRIPESSGTCIQCGALLANQEITINGRTGVKKNAILLSDGRANRVNGSRVGDSAAVTAALNEIKKGFSDSQTIYYTIGFGSDVNSNFLQQAASATGGTYHFSPTENELDETFTRIAEAICQ